MQPATIVGVQQSQSYQTLPYAQLVYMPPFVPQNVYISPNASQMLQSANRPQIQMGSFAPSVYPQNALQYPQNFPVPQSPNEPQQQITGAGNFLPSIQMLQSSPKTKVMVVQP